MPAGKTYEPIATTTLSTTSDDITFSSIPGTYTDLVLVIEGYAATADGYGVAYRVNGDSGNNYSHTNIYGSGSLTASNRTSNSSLAFISYGVGLSTTSTNRAVITVNFQNYSNTTVYKSAVGRSVSAGGSYPGTEIITSLWRSTSAITSIVVISYLSAQFAAGTIFTLYGIAAA